MHYDYRYSFLVDLNGDFVYFHIMCGGHFENVGHLEITETSSMANKTSIFMQYPHISCR